MTLCRSCCDDDHDEDVCEHGYCYVCGCKEHCWVDCSVADALMGIFGYRRIRES